MRDHPLPRERASWTIAERAAIIKKTALSLWERGDREAVGEGVLAATTRQLVLKSQDQVIGGHWINELAEESDRHSRRRGQCFAEIVPRCTGRRGVESPD